jgi:hypothetical protein
MIAPAPTPRRRWLSYSLRTMFVLVTVLCVWLGVYVNRAERQKRAVAWIKAHDGEVHYDYEYTQHPTEPSYFEVKVDGSQLIRGFEYDKNGEEISPQPPGPRWLRDLLGMDYFATVVDAEIRDVENEQDLPPIKDLPRLRYLTVYRLPDVGWADIHRLSQLQSLNCECDRITDANLEQISHLVTLRKLVLDMYSKEATITDSQLKYLDNLTVLEELEIYSRGTDAELERLSKAATSPSMFFIRTGGGKLRITDAGLSHLQRLKNLESLSLDGEQLTEVGIANLSGLPRLSALELSAKINDAGFQVLRKMTQLEFLELHAHSSSEPAVKELKNALPTLNMITSDSEIGFY